MALTIDRMEIDDAGANPKKLAEAIVKQLPSGLRSIPVREIATAIDIYPITEAVLDGLEGGLIVPEDKSHGAILVHSERHESRKRYTIAHEIGHYVNPTHRSSSPNGFMCSRNDMCVFRRIRPPIPTTSGHLFRAIRPPVTRCHEAAFFGYQS